MPAVKLPLTAAAKDAIDHIRLKSTATNAIVILLDQATSDCQVSAMTDNQNQVVQMLQQTLHAIQKSRRGNAGLIIQN